MGNVASEKACSILVDLGAITAAFQWIRIQAILPTVIIPTAASNIAAGVQSGATMRMHQERLCRSHARQIMTCLLAQG